MAQILGRYQELAAIERLLESRAAGLSVLLLHGGHGMGKTTLWAATIALAGRRGFRILQSRPAEAEARLAFSSLGDLLSGVTREHLRALPMPQGQALEAALLRAGIAGDTVDRRSVSTAVLGVLQALARAGPLVIAIDDWQWVDPPSLHVLQFALRRLHQQSVAAILTLRSGSSFSLDASSSRSRSSGSSLVLSASRRCTSSWRNGST